MHCSRCSPTYSALGDFLNDNNNNNNNSSNNNNDDNTNKL